MTKMASVEVGIKKPYWMTSKNYKEGKMRRVELYLPEGDIDAIGKFIVEQKWCGEWESVEDMTPTTWIGAYIYKKWTDLNGTPFWEQTE